MDRSAVVTSGRGRRAVTRQQSRGVLGESQRRERRVGLAHRCPVRCPNRASGSSSSSSSSAAAAAAAASKCDGQDEGLRKLRILLDLVTKGPGVSNPLARTVDGPECGPRRRAPTACARDAGRSRGLAARAGSLAEGKECYFLVCCYGTFPAESPICAPRNRLLFSRLYGAFRAESPMCTPRNLGLIERVLVTL
eukprot:SAG31_NODE_2430_length_5708_cov_2.891246_2_plen_194_part_00